MPSFHVNNSSDYNIIIGYQGEKTNISPGGTASISYGFLDFLRIFRSNSITIEYISDEGRRHRKELNKVYFHHSEPIVISNSIIKYKVVTYRNGPILAVNDETWTQESQNETMQVNLPFRKYSAPPPVTSPPQYTYQRKSTENESEYFNNDFKKHSNRDNYGYQERERSREEEGSREGERNESRSRRHYQLSPTEDFKVAQYQYYVLRDYDLARSSLDRVLKERLPKLTHMNALLLSAQLNIYEAVFFNGRYRNSGLISLDNCNKILLSCNEKFSGYHQELFDIRLQLANLYWIYGDANKAFENMVELCTSAILLKNDERRNEQMCELLDKVLKDEPMDNLRSLQRKITSPRIQPTVSRDRIIFYLKFQLGEPTSKGKSSLTNLEYLLQLEKTLLTKTNNRDNNREIFYLRLRLGELLSREKRVEESLQHIIFLLKSPMFINIKVVVREERERLVAYLFSTIFENNQQENFGKHIKKLQEIRSLVYKNSHALSWLDRKIRQKIDKLIIIDRESKSPLNFSEQAKNIKEDFKRLPTKENSTQKMLENTESLFSYSQLSTLRPSKPIVENPPEPPLVPLQSSPPIQNPETKTLQIELSPSPPLLSTNSTDVSLSCTTAPVTNSNTSGILSLLSPGQLPPKEPIIENPTPISPNRSASLAPENISPPSNYSKSTYVLSSSSSAFFASSAHTSPSISLPVPDSDTVGISSSPSTESISVETSGASNSISSLTNRSADLGSESTSELSAPQIGSSVSSFTFERETASVGSSSRRPRNLNKTGQSQPTTELRINRPYK